MPRREPPARIEALALDALAVDYDRTLTDESLRPVPAALSALAAARRAGKRIVVVSGRGLPFLEVELGEAVDAIVAENGCLVRGPDGTTATGAPPWDLRTHLDPLDLAIEYGELLASAEVEATPRLHEALLAARIDADLVPNRDRVMVLPRGIDKAAGLRRALDLLGIDPERTAAAGDGENDVPMLLLAGHRIAVANAVDEVKRVAHEVTQEYGGHGVARWVHARWLGRTVDA